MDFGNFFLVHVNYLAVLVCGVAAMAIGFVWYGPLFGKSWMKLVGMSKDKMLAANKEMPKTYGLMFVSAIVMAYALAHFIWYAQPWTFTVFVAVKTAIWAWLGFVATYALTKFLYATDKKPWSLYVIETGYYLVTLVVMAVILGVLK